VTESDTPQPLPTPGDEENDLRERTKPRTTGEIRKQKETNKKGALTVSGQDALIG
jgi:hypothetical protein